MTKRSLRLLRLVPAGLAIAWGFASAQTTGTLIGVVTDAATGKPVAGALVIATSPNLQGEQTAVTDEGGNYRITLLPPGPYRLAVQLQGYQAAERADIRLGADKTLRANLVATPEVVRLEEQVVRTGAPPVINVGSAESGAVVSKEFIANVPVGRGFENIAAIAPAATGDLYGISFAGAQSPENQYIIDGQNVTDPVWGTRVFPYGTGGPAALLSNFYEEIDVKTGSFGADYGRATGGVFNVVLKGGSNEYHGEVWSTLTPRSWVQPDGRPAGGAGEAVAFKLKPDAGAIDLDLGFHVGGPILKDKLWFFAGFAPVYSKIVYQRYLRKNRLVAGGDVDDLGSRLRDPNGNFIQDTIPGTQRDVAASSTGYQWVGKLTYLLDENNSFTASGWGTPTSRSDLEGRFNGPLSSVNGAPSTWTTFFDENVYGVHGKYSGKFADKKLLVEGLAGYFVSNQQIKPRSAGGVDKRNTPRMEWVEDRNVDDFEPTPDCAGAGLAACPVFDYITGGAFLYGSRDTSRVSGKISLSYFLAGLGSHHLKAGLDLERVEYDVKNVWAGGWYYLKFGNTIQAFRGYGFINDGSPATTDPSNVTPVPVFANKSRADNFAYFVQDSWSILDTGVTLNLGLRLDTQHMHNLTYTLANGFDINDNWGPRVQAIWDFTGAGRGKVSASWGRFYYAFPLRMGERAFGNERQLNWFVSADTCPGWPASLAGGGAAGFDTRNVSYLACALAPGSAFRPTGSLFTPVDPNIKGQYVDEFGGAVEYEVLPDMSVGLVYEGRRQGNVIEDMSPDDGANYFVGNPGRDSSFAGLNSRYVTTTDPQTGRTLTIVMPRPERSYDGITLKLTKLFSRNWLAQASYTYSVLRGNYAGPFRAEDGQLDPGITSEYDLATLMANRKGYLPQDITHQLKLFGAYVWNLSPRFNLRAGGAYRGRSGTPVNALGGHPIYGPGQAFLIPRGQGGRTPFTHAVDLGGALEYVIQPPYTVRLGIDVFNLFNSQTVQLYDENYTFDAVLPVAVNCRGRNSAGKANPVAALEQDCPELNYLKTVDGRKVTTNPNWGRPQATANAFQQPISVRLSLALTF